MNSKEHLLQEAIVKKECAVSTYNIEAVLTSSASEFVAAAVSLLCCPQ